MTDNGKGAFEVTELTYDGKTELPVFTNTYVKPVEPPKDDSGLRQDGDSTSTSERMGCCARSLDRALTRLRREGLVVSTPVFNKVGGPAGQPLYGNARRHRAGTTTRSARFEEVTRARTHRNRGAVALGVAAPCRIQGMAQLSEAFMRNGGRNADSKALPRSIIK